MLKTVAALTLISIKPLRLSVEGIFLWIHTGRSSHSWLFLISSDGSVKSDLGIGNPGMALWRWKPNVTNQMFTSAQGERSRWGEASVQNAPHCSFIKSKQIKRCDAMKRG